jgi:CheY-like chemotaxis protein
MGQLVMVVEDDQDNLDSIVELLVDEGYEVLAARSGGEARDQLAAAQPCVALVDYLLPDMTGAELVQIFRARPGDPVPVVILTAVSQPTELDDDVPVLKKPVTMDDLLEVLRRYCATPARL